MHQAQTLLEQCEQRFWQRETTPCSQDDINQDSVGSTLMLTHLGCGAVPKNECSRPIRCVCVNVCVYIYIYIYLCVCAYACVSKYMREYERTYL